MTTRKRRTPGKAKGAASRKPKQAAPRKKAPAPKQATRKLKGSVAAAGAAIRRVGTVAAPIRVARPVRVTQPLRPARPIRHIPPFEIEDVSPISNFLRGAKPGQAAVRSEDLLAIRIELRNLSVVPGAKPRLRKDAAGPAYLVLHFPPQSITEQTFWEARPQGGSEFPKPPPVRARISGESRLAFTIPDGFDVDYTLEGILEACQSLAPSVAPNARPRAGRRRIIGIGDLFTRDVAKLSDRERAALSGFAMRSLRIGALQGDLTTLQLRQLGGGKGLRPIVEGLASIEGLHLGPGDLVRPFAVPPSPAPPTAVQTAIEMPWRLVLSPHAGERWNHSPRPVHSAATDRTELWHSRLVAPPSDGSKLIQPPHPDPQRTVRAIWALTGVESTHEMGGDYPDPEKLPDPDDQLPFRMPMYDYDRFQIAHLSSNFAAKGYVPNPIDTNLLMLSSLGGWLDSRGAWDPVGLSLEEWVHRASMGRDHYVRVVNKGFLYPFGHRVSLVTLSERKFHNGSVGPNPEYVNPTKTPGEPPRRQLIEQVPGNVAYLRQRMFIVVREPERRFSDPDVCSTDGSVRYQNQFPFSSVKLLTKETPNLDSAASTASRIEPYGNKKLFWPCVNGDVFKFPAVATDLDGKPVSLELPMIFMINELACPRDPKNPSLPAYGRAEDAAKAARDAWRENPARKDRRIARLNQQRVALAPSMKAGDTSVEVVEMAFDGMTEKGNTSLQRYSQKLTRPVFYPVVEWTRARIGAIATLSGGNGTNKLEWNAHYSTQAFKDNVGQVFVNVAPETGMAQLDFSAKGDRSGGFVQPNLTPSVLSRMAGPISGDPGTIVTGALEPAGLFPGGISDLPLPLLFGCIPLGEVIERVASMAGSPEKVPKFVNEASTKVEAFVNGLVRLYDFVRDLASAPERLVQGAAEAAKRTLEDLVSQAQALSAAQLAKLKKPIDDLAAALAEVASQIGTLAGKSITDAPALPGLATAIATAKTRATELATAADAKVGGVSLPSGLRQSVLGAAKQLEEFLADLETLTALLAEGKALYTALGEVVADPNGLEALLKDAGLFKKRVGAIQLALGPIKATLAGFRLLEGSPRQVILDAISLVEAALTGAEAIADLVQMLMGEELVLRFDWNPEIKSWPGPGDKALFRANDLRGFLVAVEAKVKKSGGGDPKISVTCSLKQFDLVLIAPASFIELNFEKIEFKVDSGAKMNVDVVLTDIKFVGPLSFVETLRDLIPLDGFSDPPYLDITTKGIDAGFSITLPNISVGVFNLSNLALGAGFTVPFIGEPLSVRFNFCTREQPFNLTVSLFGGGGFFGITLDPSGVQILEAAFEFGASISIDFGVASGGVEVMAGVYFRMEGTAASLTGYFRLGGHVSVLGLISASLELYLELRYEFETGKCVGKAELTIEVEVFLFSVSVTVTCERKFAGSNGDPSFRDLMGWKPELALPAELAAIDDTTRYAWREYCEAFA